MDDQQFWEKRRASLGRAQSRYLWLLLLLGVFFLSLEAVEEGAEVLVPGLGVLLNGATLRLVAPMVIFGLIVVSHGALRAYGATSPELGLPTELPESIFPENVRRAEALDVSPNAIDLAVYTRERFRRFPHFLLLFAYPVYMLAFAFEATFFLGRRLTEQVHEPFRQAILWTAFILGAVAFPQILKLFWRRIRMIAEAVKLRRKGELEGESHQNSGGSLGDAA